MPSTLTGGCFCGASVSPDATVARDRPAINAPVPAARENRIYPAGTAEAPGRQDDADDSAGGARYGRRMPSTLTGGCFCGAVRYEVTGAPRDVSYCHCSMCRRTAGAPAVPWATYPTTAVRLTQGTPAVLRSSPPATRRFCAACGTPLTFATSAEPEWVDVTVCSLDDPEAVPPDEHIWTESRVAWFDVRDDLPRHPRSRG